MVFQLRELETVVLHIYIRQVSLTKDSYPRRNITTLYDPANIPLLSTENRKTYMKNPPRERGQGESITCTGTTVFSEKDGLVGNIGLWDHVGELWN